MPMFVVSTNVAKDAVPSTLLSEATEELAKAMGKPAQVGQNHAHSCAACAPPGFYYDPKPELLFMCEDSRQISQQVQQKST